MALHIDLRVEEENWLSLGELEPICQRALEAAYDASMPDAHIDVLLTDDSVLQALNTQWRGKPKPTDILSFPAAPNPENFLGDIAIAYGTAMRDADASQITACSHLSHLLVHGLLHLLGHDHIDDEEAETMEALERAALAKLEIDDPYSRIAQSTAILRKEQ